MATRLESLPSDSQGMPYGVGRLTGRWLVLVVALLAIVGVGLFAYSRQLVEGLVVTGLRDIGTMGGSAWGLYIAFDVYFVGISFAGITIAALIRLFNLEHLKPVSRMAELLTVISLLLAAFSVLPDLGQPVRGFINLFRYARPQSPFFGTFTLVVAGYMFASLVYLYLDGRHDAAILAQQPSRLQWFHRLWAAGYRDTPAERERHARTTFWLAIAILPLLVTAHSTLGFVFGLQVGRPGWFGTLQAPGFVIMAGISGLGMLIVIAAILRRVLHVEDQLNENVFNWLGSLLLFLILIYMYFMVVEWLTTTYAAHHHEAKISAALLTGEYAWLFWSAVIALVVSLGVLILPRLPAPAGLRMPAYQPTYARIAGAGAAAVALIMVLQSLPTTRQAGLSLAPDLAGWLRWLLVGLLALFGMTLLPLLRRDVVVGAALSGILVNVAAIFKRFLIVVPSQTHGTLLPYSVGFYRPTWVEYSIIVGLFALGALLYITFIKVFPIMEVQESRLDG